MRLHCISTPKEPMTDQKKQDRLNETATEHDTHPNPDRLNGVGGSEWLLAAMDSIPAQTQAALDEANAILAEGEAIRERVRTTPGLRLRVVRVLVYEGDAKAVHRVLGMSLPPGWRDSQTKQGGYTITVHEGERVYTDPTLTSSPVPSADMVDGGLPKP